jgi:hypothetical protein
MSATANVNPKKEVLTPEPDGVEVEFNTSEPYRAGSITLWMNGQLIQKDADNGFAELGDSVIQMYEAPLVGDCLQVEYDPE